MSPLTTISVPWMAARESVAVIRPWQLPRAQTDTQVPQAGPALSFFCSFSLRRSLIAGQPSPTLKHLCTRPHSLRFLFLTRTRMQRAACIYSNLCPRAWPAVPKATFLTPVVSSIQRSCLPPPFRLMRTENCMQVVHRTPLSTLQIQSIQRAVSLHTYKTSCVISSQMNGL